MAKVESSLSETNFVNLSRLLSRLDKIILGTSNENDLLRRSGLERKRVGANLDYARTLLFQLEQETLAVRGQQRKQNLQADLAERKEQVTRLNERLYQLNEADEDDLGVGNGEDLLSEDDVRETESKGDIVPSAESKNATISTGAPLDRRKPFSSGDDLQRNALFGKPQALADAGKEDIGITTSSDVNPNLSQTEKLLSHNRMEQEDLTASLLDMAHALKASSQAFSSSLESEKEILDRASEGLEKNTTGMEAAGKRMGALRRMSEGRGWLGRMLMYAWIMGLMMIALIIVVVLPKFRF